MESRVKIYADGGNRLTKIMEESRKPFDFPTIISEPERELNYGVNFDFDLSDWNNDAARLEVGSMFVEIIKDGVSKGKMLVGKAAEEKGLLIRDRNRYEEKANDEVIMFSIIAGVAFNLAKNNKNYQKIDLTVNQPLIEYARNKEVSANRYTQSLMGNMKVIFYNLFNPTQVLYEVYFDVEKVVLCPEGIAAFFQYAVNEDGSLKSEFKNDKKTIVWDIGSGQINVAAFDGSRVAGVNTFEKGMFDCYEKISMILYNNFRDRLDRKPYSYEVDNMIRFNSCILKGKKGEDIDAGSIVNNVFDIFAYELSKDLREFAKIKFMGNCDSLIFAGGGSKILFDYLDKYLGKDFVCMKSSIGEYDNVVGSMYYRLHRDARTNVEG